jgi:site-specific recombinase XerD
MKTTDFSDFLSRYLGLYLPAQSGAGINTLRSYRDTFSLFLRYFRDKEKLPPQKLTLDKITHHEVEQFLLWLENERGCLATTRNNRLAAIHAFYRYLQFEAPEYLNRCQEILSIPYKKTQKKVMSYLSLDMVKSLLELPDSSTKLGRRDMTLLSLLYDTGARVQELCDLRFEDVRLSNPVVIRLTGKGNKSRLVPIMKPTEKLLRQYMAEHDPNYSAHGGYPLFCNRDGKKLTRAGVTYILDKYASELSTSGSVSFPEKVSPHCLRHSKAMHLLQSGVNLVYIRDLLGHADVSTTEVYARADEHFKREALEKAYPSPSPATIETSWHKDSDLLDWLKNLGR